MDAGSVSSLQASMANSSARSTPIPSNYKPLTPSSSILALSNMPDEEIRRRGTEDLVQIVRRLENAYLGVISEHGSIMKDVNKKMQILLLEVRGLKDINQTLQDDNQELRDLCCFLDDDRQRGRKLAREWQRFGRYTASVMRSEVSAYQEKLKELEQKQQELSVDNLELKELCLFLDQERLRVVGVGQMRDEGDGSSSSTVAGVDDIQSDGIELLPVNQLHGSNNANSDYVIHLEEQIRNLEEEKRTISQELDVKMNKHTGTNPGSQTQPGVAPRLGPDGNQSQDGGTNTSPNKPEAVVHAMKVLEVHENLERTQTHVGEDNLDDKEKAIVREMCNVVWRKLGNVSAEQQESGTSTPQHPVYENIQPGGDRPPLNDPIGEPPNGGNSQMHPSYHPHSYTHQYHQGQPSRVNTESGQLYNQHARSSMEHGGNGGIYTAQPVPQSQRVQSGHGFTPQGSQQILQGQGQGGRNYPPQAQSQRPPPNSYPSGGQGPPPQNYSSQTSAYGYARTTHSTPVTPTPIQRSHSPVTKPHSMSNPNMRPEPRSHSPGPNRVSQPKPTPQTSSQRPVQGSTHLYQNHPMGKGDHSYENIQYAYNPTSEVRSVQQAPSTGRNDHPPPPHIGSHYTHTDIPAPSPGYQTRSYPTPSTSSSSSSQDHHQGNQSSAHYQNVQVRQAIPVKHKSRRDPSPQGYNQRQGSNSGPPPQGSYNRNMQNTPSYSQQYPPPSTPQVTRRPAQPQYNRDGYPEPRDVPRQYHESRDGRGRQNPYN